jgi:hypothetical protein
MGVMLRHYRYEEEPLPDGKGVRMWLTDELVDDPCSRCGGESVPNVCAGDGRYHHHGRVHTVERGLEPLCRMCAELDAEAWGARRR